MDKKHRADRIWATRSGTFYRDAKTKIIFGCGKNTEQNVSAVKELHQKMEFIYHPVKTTFRDAEQLGDKLVMGPGDALHVTSWDEEASTYKWSPMGRKASSVAYGADSTHFITEEGDVFEFRTQKRVAPIYVASENDSARALCVGRTKQKFFLIVDKW